MGARRQRLAAFVALAILSLGASVGMRLLGGTVAVPPMPETAGQLAPGGVSTRTSTPALDATDRQLFPRDLAEVTSIAERKELFVNALLPLVIQENRRIEDQRRWLAETRDVLLQGDASQRQRQRLAKLARYYRLRTIPEPGSDEPTPAAVIDELSLRVDTLPPSLILAQAAMESGWGTSRFAREGNNLFGQWVTGSTPGLSPAEASSDDFRLASYESVAHSVGSYLRNLNTHRAYRKLRQRRAELRAQGNALDPTLLAPGLTRYSARGHEYVEELLQIIRHNQLTRLDRAQVEDPAPVAG
jgi:Bax protein